MDRRGRAVDVRDRTGRRDRLQVLVVHTVLGDVGRQSRPILLRGQVDCRGRKKFAATLSLGLPNLVDVLAEVLARGVLGILETFEAHAALAGNCARGLDCLVGNGHEVHIREVQGFFAAVVDVLAGEVAVEVHLAKADGVAHGVTTGDRRHRLDIRQVGDGGQAADCGLDGLGEVRGIHGLRDIERTQVAGNVLTNV